MRRISVRTMFAVAALAALQACSVAVRRAPRPARGRRDHLGVAVDPYVIGAVLQELEPDRRVVQESSPSTRTASSRSIGRSPAGNVVAIAVKGLHDERPTPYASSARSTSTTNSSSSPDHDLLAGGRTPAEVVATLNGALDASLTASDLKLDPMAPGTTDRSLLAAAVSVGAALEILHGNVASGELAGIVAALAPKIEAALGASGSLAAVSSAAAAIAAYVARHATDATSAAAAAAQVDAALIAALVAAAGSGQPVALDDALAVALAPGTVASHVEKGMAALEAALASSTVPTETFLRAVEEFWPPTRWWPSTPRRSRPTRTRPASSAARPGRAPAAAVLRRDRQRVERPRRRARRVRAPRGRERGALDPSAVMSCTDTYYSDGMGGSYYAGQQCELRTLPSSSPTAGALQAFLAGQVASGLRAAVAALGKVGPGFSAQVNDAGRVVEFDATDALFLRGVAQGMLAFIEVQQAYDLDVDLDALQASSGFAADEFLRAHPTFLRLASAASLPASRLDAIGAIESLQLAVAALRAETAADDQADDFIRIASESCGWVEAVYVCTSAYNASSELDEFVSGLASAHAVAVATGPYRFDAVTAETSDDVVVEPDRFFAGVDLRAKLPTSFGAGLHGGRPGPFPTRPSEGSSSPSPSTSTPILDGDGSPDLFGGYTMFGGWLRGATLYPAWWWSAAFPYLDGPYSFAATGNAFTFSDFDGGVYSGTWTASEDVLTLSFAPEHPLGVARRRSSGPTT